MNKRIILAIRRYNLSCSYTRDNASHRQIYFKQLIYTVYTEDCLGDTV